MLGKHFEPKLTHIQKHLEEICRNVDVLASSTTDFMREHPECADAAHEAGRTYLGDLMALQPQPCMRPAAELLRLSLEEVTLANSLSVMALFGLSHYLHWRGSDIEEPTRFDELSTKLGFARNGLAYLGYRLAWGMRTHRDSCQPEVASAERLASVYKRAFGMGMTIGYLLEDMWPTTFPLAHSS